MGLQTPIVERAFELASSGLYANVTEVQKALKAEGYTNIMGHTEPRTVRRQLAKLCVESRKP